MKYKGLNSENKQTKKPVYLTGIYAYMLKSTLTVSKYNRDITFR